MNQGIQHWTKDPGKDSVVKGRARGIEPPYGGITIRCLNRLATPAAVEKEYISRLHARTTAPSTAAAGTR